MKASVSKQTFWVIFHFRNIFLVATKNPLKQIIGLHYRSNVKEMEVVHQTIMICLGNLARSARKPIILLLYFPLRSKILTGEIALKRRIKKTDRKKALSFSPTLQKSPSPNPIHKNASYWCQL